MLKNTGITKILRMTIPSVGFFSATPD